MAETAYVSDESLTQLLVNLKEELYPFTASWSTSSDEDIVEAVARADAGQLDLYEDLGWRVGDERQVSLGSIAASGTANGVSWSVGESHAAQTVTLVLMHHGGYNLTSPTSGGRQQCSFVVGMKNSLAESGYMNSTNTNSGSWNACARRTWCNGGFWNSIPSTLRPIFKQFQTVTAQTYDGSTNQTTNDYFALEAAAEVFKGDSSYGQGGTAGQQTAHSNLTEFNALFRFTWYETTSNRIKNLGDTGSACPWWERSPNCYGSNAFCGVNVAGNAYSTSASTGVLGLAPFGCI